MTAKQWDALMAACLARGALRVAIEAYAMAQRSVRLAIDRAKQITTIAEYADRMYDRTDQALESSGDLLQAVLNEIGDLIVELKLDSQPQEPQDYSI